MAGRVQWEAQVDSNVAKLLQETKELRDQLDGIKNGKYDIKLNVDDKKLENVISNLDKMLNSLGKGTGDFKQFENLSKELSGVISEVHDLSKAFGKVDDSGTQTLLSSIQSIDKSLSSLSEHILNVNKDFGNVGKNTSNNVQDINAATTATEKLAEATKDLGRAQQNLRGNKSNISSKDSSLKDVFQDGSDSSSTAIANEEVSAMEKVETATEQATQAKQDFVTANENVQSSVDDSKSPLQLEAELMQQIAKDARDAADAKKEFVEANKQVEQSANDSNGAVKKDKYKNRNKISESAYNSDPNYYASIANKKLLANGNSILGNSVNTEFIDGLVKVSAKIKTADGDWKSFSARIDEDGNMFEQRFKSITKGVNKLNSELENFEKDTVSTPKSDTQKSVDKALKEQVSAWKKIESIRVETEKTDPNNKKRISELEEIKELYQKQYNEAGKVLKANQDLYNVEKQNEKLNQITLETTAEITKYKAKQKESTLSSLQSDVNSYKSVLDSLNKRPEAKQSDDYKQKLAEYKRLFEELGNETKQLEELKVDVISDEELADFNDLKKQLDETKLGFDKIFKGTAEVSATKVIQRMTKYLEDFTGISKKAKVEIQGLIDKLQTEGINANPEEVLNTFLKLATAEKAAGRECKSWLDVIKDKAWYGFAAQIGTYFSFNDIMNIGKQAASIVTELNTQITDLAKVSEATSKQIYADFDSYADIAKDIGGTISDTISATADWSRNGYSIPDSKELAEVALLYKNVGDGIDIDEANESLISTLRGFKMEAEEAIDIVDIFNEVDILASYYSNVIALCA